MQFLDKEIQYHKDTDFTKKYNFLCFLTFMLEQLVDN